VPITARLSKRFYDQLGEDVVNELVGLLNLIDGTYRSELRDTNEANWARFDAKLEVEIGQIRAELAQFKAEMRADMAELAGRRSNGASANRRVGCSSPGRRCSSRSSVSGFADRPRPASEVLENLPAA